MGNRLNRARRPTEITMSTLTAPSATTTLAPSDPLLHPAPTRRSSLGLAQCTPTVRPASNRLQATWVSVVTEENAESHLEMRWEVTRQQ